MKHSKFLRYGDNLNSDSAFEWINVKNLAILYHTVLDFKINSPPGPLALASIRLYSTGLYYDTAVFLQAAIITGFSMLPLLLVFAHTLTGNKPVFLSATSATSVTDITSDHNSESVRVGESCLNKIEMVHYS